MFDETQNIKVLSHLAATDFIGRNAESAELWRTANDEAAAQGILLLSAPAAGASELLRQTYDRLFGESKDIIPFYFAFSDNDKTAKQAAVRFLQTFLQQTVAFRRRDARLLSIAPDACEISNLAAPTDAPWIHQLIASCKLESDLIDEASFVRLALSAPVRAATNSARVFVMIDDLHKAENLTGEAALIEELKEIYSRAGLSFVFAGRRRFVLSATQGGNARLANAKLMRLGELSEADAELLIENLSVRYAVKINEQTRDLIIRQFRANPSFIGELFRAAQENRNDLDSFFQVQKVAIDALFSGNFGRYYDRLFNEIAPNRKTQKEIIGLLCETDPAGERRTPIEVWNERLALSFEEVYRLIRLLNIHEIARTGGGSVELDAENTLLQDYIEARRRLEILSAPRALVVSDILSNALKRAPQMMTRFYRRASAIGLKELLSVFNCQKTPAALFDYAVFKEKHKGAEDAEIRRMLDAESEKIALPQVIYTAHTVAFYPPIAQFAETERTAVALGFEAADYREESEIVWIAAQIDSKLEAERDLTEFWCDRLEAVALMCNFPRYRLWLVAPEGFSGEAIEVLRERNAYGSSRKQVELLVAHLKAENVINERMSASEYEIIVPMGDDTEMIAAHAVEEIARRHAFKPAAINQIKTALVEACINAAEHSHSPDRRIYQKFTVEDDKIVITIANRGVKIPAEKVLESESRLTPTEGRRGWGLKLMRGLMDEVNFEQTDDGTRISMVKFRK
ncbi:MAG TPA: ATP-binding protein [Pyrinomonadaceae bacterium]